MNTVPFLYVNLIALCCYVLLLCVALAAEKTPPVRLLIAILGALILWAGGSVLMRLQVMPGMDFWFYLSIMALFSVGVPLYFFVESFAALRCRASGIVWTVGTIALLAPTALGLFIQPPTVQEFAGGTAFVYEVGWEILIPLAFFACIVVSIARNLYKLARDRGISAPGVIYLIAGCVAMAAGNMAQVAIPGNVFPWDMVGGIAFAMLMVMALYKRRMLRMKLLVPRGALLAVSVAICALVAIYWVPSLQALLAPVLPGEGGRGVAVVLIFTALLAGVYSALKALIDMMFAHEGHQGKRLITFSSAVSRTLNSDEIMDALIYLLQDSIPVQAVHVCMRGKNGYTMQYTSDPAGVPAVSIPWDSRVPRHLGEGHPYLVLDDLLGTEDYTALVEAEPKLFRTLGIRCAAAIRHNGKLEGVVLLTAKEKKQPFTSAELNLLETASSIASMALRNASLYERVLHEVRADNLTGVYNYKYFLEKVELDFSVTASLGSKLALVLLDIDDFNLYNQLYGVTEGDRTLKAVADIMLRTVKGEGTVYRYSGKMFALLLPGHTAESAYTLAGEIQMRASGLNRESTRAKLLTLSVGIATGPDEADSAQELVENANLAIYNTKTMGKGKVSVFRKQMPTHARIAARAMEIVGRRNSAEDSLYRVYSPTIMALTAAIDAKDHYTYDHSQNVARYASILATAIGLTVSQVRLVYEAAILHDIGKISIPEAILSKNSALTDEEFEIIRGHVNNSIDMIRHLPSMDYVIPAAVGHHERWDGKGYPMGTAGDSIPLSARCLALADAFDAMTTDRPYRGRMPLSYAVEQIVEHAGTQFDPELAEVFVGLIRSGEITVDAAPDGVDGGACQGKDDPA